MNEIAENISVSGLEQDRISRSTEKLDGPGEDGLSKLLFLELAGFKG